MVFLNHKFLSHEVSVAPDLTTGGADVRLERKSGSFPAVGNEDKGIWNMTEFQELIKNFDRIRDYMRQFYIYGFKVRSDYDKKSARTYDNERRRIESWLSDYMESGYTSKGKQVYINVDSRTISQNPLYAAWKAKSFTDNDIMLHFFILDQLWEQGEGMSAGELGDRMAERYGVVFDSQTIRLKLKEYEELGILRAVKKGKSLAYFLKPCFSEETDDMPGRGTWEHVLTAVKFFQEAAPFGFLGSTILDWENTVNDMFQFKHHFIVHTLEDGVLFTILEAIQERRRISFVNKSSRSGNTSVIKGLPLRIVVSVRTGRRYVCCYLENRRRFMNYRLDCIWQVEMAEECGEYEQWRELLKKNIGRCWGVSFGGPGRLEEIRMKVYIDEEKETYILDRLRREGRGGEIIKTGENEYLYCGTFFDTNEMLSWVKTFTGRILDIEGSNPIATAKVKRDWERMYEMYCED